MGLVVFAAAIRVHVLSGPKPDWTQVAAAIGTCVAALGFLAAAVGTFLAWKGLEDNAKGRTAQIAIDLGRRWDGQDLADVRQQLQVLDPHGFKEKIMEIDKKPEYGAVEALANFFEDLGVLYRLRILSFEWIDQTLGSSVFRYWNLWHLVIRDARTITQNHEAYRNWESLAQAILEHRPFLRQDFPEFPSGDPQQTSADSSPPPTRPEAENKA